MYILLIQYLYRDQILLSNSCARGVMVIIVGNGYSDMSSNPAQYPWESYESNYSPSSYG